MAPTVPMGILYICTQLYRDNILASEQPKQKHYNLHFDSPLVSIDMCLQPVTNHTQNANGTLYMPEPHARTSTHRQRKHKHKHVHAINETMDVYQGTSRNCGRPPIPTEPRSKLHQFHRDSSQITIVIELQLVRSSQIRETRHAISAPMGAGIIGLQQMKLPCRCDEENLNRLVVAMTEATNPTQRMQ